MSNGQKLQVVFFTGMCVGTAVAAAAGVSFPLAIVVGTLIGAVVIRVAHRKIEGETT